MINLRNLKINETDIQDIKIVKDAIKELNIIIEDNYEKVQKEVGIEFNIGSRLGEPKEYLVIYANPKYKNNPYVFILKQEQNNRFLVNKTDIDSFKDLADEYIRKGVNKTIAVGFNNLPKYAFLSIGQIENARDFAKTFDEENELF